MPSATTEIDVINRALVKLGASKITSLTDNGKSERVMSNIVDIVRDRFLRDNPWNPAIERVQLAVNTVAPEWGWASAYDLPSDFIKLLNVESSTQTVSVYGASNNTPQNIEYKLEGGQILCDETDALNIRYVSRLTDMTRYDPTMIEALATLYAAEACMSLREDSGLRDQLMREYEHILFEAKRNDGLDDDMYDFPTDDWIIATL